MNEVTRGLGEKESQTQDNLKPIIKGRVSSPEGVWLSGARITCGDVTTIALADGTYILSGLTPGIYELEASLQGYSTVRSSVSVPENGELELNLVLPKAVGTAKIHGTVIDSETSQPIGTGMVILVLPIANRYTPIDSEGHYEFSELPTGTYKLYSSIPGYGDQGAEVIISDDQAVVHDIFCKPVKIEEPPWG